MKNTLLFTLAAFGLLLFAQCKNDAAATQDYIFFGDKIDEKEAISVSDALSKLNDAEEIEAKVVGHVESVCQAKGCWMNLTQPGNDDQAFFVKFKDYGFFVPKDLSGSKVVVEGKAFKEVTDVAALKHYAEDEGKSQEEIDAITEPVEEYKFVAHGVKILERAAH